MLEDEESWIDRDRKKEGGAEGDFWGFWIRKMWRMRSADYLSALLGFIRFYFNF